MLSFKHDSVDGGWGYYCLDCEIFINPDVDGELYCYQCGFKQNKKDVKREAKDANKS